MIDYDKIISQWQANVSHYCAAHGIASIELKNLRTGDVYDYDLYVAYKRVLNSIGCYRKAKESPAYQQELVASIKAWYVLTSNSKLRQISMRVMPNQTFARYIQRTK